ncbi:hypothetical protein CFC21_068777 [Triticum aestivum]|uniref:Defensin n=3 Tax=Triticum TaxID=4564 RepID=A0A9R1HA15_WHEAT|nr:defensin Ec-AMP-D2-like [Triticum dicoccoides]XP_044386057.1 defensin Ec-AMP-D2-like [Triticum aestivum]XP_048527129.1 defensin Ec-AMP-D2-like [Triticum urartu]AIA67005.1 defensin [Triticum aestivum]EMS65297.1 Defensin SD2 [Triticum urartu]KAF7062142.1 hypothetical protein CFC21_068777 [Triticum aestivum]
MGKLVSAALLLVLLLAATGEMGGPVAVAEARRCESLSHRFAGLCLRGHNCANVCRTEGFPDGKCRGARRRCFCTTHCR